MSPQRQRNLTQRVDPFRNPNFVPNRTVRPFPSRTPGFPISQPPRPSSSGSYCPFHKTSTHDIKDCKNLPPVYCSHHDSTTHNTSNCRSLNAMAAGRGN